MTKNIKPNPTYGEIRKKPIGEMEWEKVRGTEYWDYRRKWVECPKQMYVSDFPLHLDIETTNACNLKCPMCPRTILAAKGILKIGSLDFDFYKYLIDQGVDNGVASVKLNYLGEPLVHKDIVKQIRYAKDRGVIDVMFNTNATLLTEEMSRQILDAGVDNVFFSVDSPYKEKYESIRIGANFDEVVNNIKKFVEIRDIGGYKHVQTRVSMVVMDNNQKELDDYRDFWLDIVGVVGYAECVDHISYAKEIYPSKYNPDFVCAQPFQRMFIMWDGIVVACCMDDIRGYSVGDARKEKLKDIWHGDRYKRLREAMISGHYYDIAICRKCNVPFVTPK